MQIKSKEYRCIILSVLIVAGVSIAGWAFAIYYDNPTTGAIAQYEPQNDSKTATVMPLERDHKKLISLLVCTGLVGFFGVRRQNDPSKRFVKSQRPDVKLHINLLNRRNMNRRSCNIWETDCFAS